MTESEWERYERDFDKNARLKRDSAREGRLAEAAKLGRQPARPHPVVIVAGGVLVAGVLLRLAFGSSSSPAAPGTILRVSTFGKQPANLRVAAGLDAAVKTTVPAGATVKVVGSTEIGGVLWYHVAGPAGDDGWVYSGVLT
jgi:hypothetical protein